VSPSGVKGLTFADEAATAIALVPKLKAAGADAIVLLIHQGGRTPQFSVGNSCDQFTGEIAPIVERLDPAITTIVSGHTHWAYICRSAPADAAGRLLTSAGNYGYFVTNLPLVFDPSTRRLLRQDAYNIVVGNGERGEDAGAKALVARYAAAVAPIANRVIGRLVGPAPNDVDDFESPAANLVADSMLAATRAPESGGAQLALVNATGVRVSLPVGDIKYEQAFAMMPFGNNLVVMTLTGQQIEAILEQQYRNDLQTPGTRPRALVCSAGCTYALDMKRPAGDRVSDLRLHGKPIDLAGRYRVAVSNFLASGGDGLTGFTAGTDITDKAIVDLDALVAWIAGGQVPPAVDRIRYTGP
jgi:5'-nucleotidase